MVSKNKLKSEIESFNKELDKHMSDVDFNQIPLSYSSKSSSQDQENLMLLSENLKEIRHEMSLMRKNMSSDVSNMVEKELQEVKTELLKEFNSFQKQVYDQLHSLDFSSLRHIEEEVYALKKQQHQFEKKLNSLPDEVSKSLSSFSTQNNELFNSFVKSLEDSQKTVLKRFEEVEDRTSNIEESISSLLQNSNSVISSINNLTQDTKSYLESPKSVNLSLKKEKKSNLRRTPKKISFNRQEADETAKRILSIDEKLSRLESLR